MKIYLPFYGQIRFHWQRILWWPHHFKLYFVKNVQDWPISQKLNQRDALRDLVPFVQFEKLDIGVLLLSKVAGWSLEFY